MDATSVYLGADPASAVYLGADLIWSGVEVDPYLAEVMADEPTVFLPLATDTLDVSGNGINGTAVGSPAFDGTKVRLNAGQYVNLPDDARLRPTTAITVEAWASSDTIAATHAIWTGHENPYQNFVFYSPNRARTEMDSNAAGAATQHASANQSVTPAVEHHMVLVYNGSTVAIYRNGVSILSAAKTGALDWGAVTSIQRLGARLAASEQLLGTMRRFALYPQALTAARVAAHYAAGTA